MGAGIEAFAPTSDRPQVSSGHGLSSPSERERVISSKVEEPKSLFEFNFKPTLNFADSKTFYNFAV